ncbi:MAG: AEC family transporter [Pseudomonadota bacterium]
MTFTLLAVGLAFGLLARRFRWVGPSTPQRINTFIINAALPAVILLKVPALALDFNAIAPVAAAWGVILFSAAVVWICSRALGWSSNVTGALLLVAPLSNSAYLGVPLLDALFDDTVVAYGAFYDQFGNFLALVIYASIVIALYSQVPGERAVDRLFRMVRQVITFVPFPVLMVAIFLMDATTLPAIVVGPLSVLGSLMGPLAAFIVGFALRFRVPQSLRLPLSIGVLTRLILAPLLVYGVARTLDVSAPAMTASVMQAAMPSMITAGLIGIKAGFSERLIVAMLSVTTVLSVLTVLLWQSIL